MSKRELINKYTKRILIDYPEEDKIHIDLDQFASELINSLPKGEASSVSENEHTQEVCEKCHKPIRMKKNTIHLLCECGINSV